LFEALALEQRPPRVAGAFGVASVNKDLFNKIEAVVHADAIAASRNNALVPNGYLQQREQTRDGHTFRTFHGSPMTWMRQFMPSGKAVKKINLRPPHAPEAW